MVRVRRLLTNPALTDIPEMNSSSSLDMFVNTTDAGQMTAPPDGHPNDDAQPTPAEGSDPADAAGQQPPTSPDADDGHPNDAAQQHAPQPSPAGGSDPTAGPDEHYELITLSSSSTAHAPNKKCNSRGHHTPTIAAAAAVNTNLECVHQSRINSTNSDACRQPLCMTITTVDSGHYLHQR